VIHLPPILQAVVIYVVCVVVQVSWIRTRDLHILTSGSLTYTSDSRFEVLHAPGSEVWTLRIMSAQPRDQGKYECQVNTDPKLNFAVFLTVKGMPLSCYICHVFCRANVNCVPFNKVYTLCSQYEGLAYYSHVNKI
jgi:hypothetical protein